MDHLEANRNLVRRFIEEVLEGGRTQPIDELVARDFVSHTWGIGENGPAMLKAATERVHASLTGVTFTIEELVAERDLVVARVTSSATAVGDFMGVPASGKSYEIGEMHMFRIRDGQIVEHWHQHDALGLMKQLGALPA